MIKKSSRISKFYTKTHSQRLNIIKEFSQLGTTETNLLKKNSSIHFNTANLMIENVVGIMPLPLGIATNFLINDKDYLIPMVIEEPSVIAAASNAAKIARSSGGFFATSNKPIIMGQIVLTKIKNIDLAQQEIHAEKKSILQLANKKDPLLVSLGGGAQNITTHSVRTKRGTMLCVHLCVHVKDAMGANIINTMAEAIAPTLEHITGGHALLKIISNFPISKITKAQALFKKDIIGKNTIEDILDATNFAEADIFRCTTHNKGIMNGIDAIAIATGNDFRAIEAGAHAFAAQHYQYKPLTKYYKNSDGDLVGTIELPITVGIVGGNTQTHPIAKTALKILRVKSASELAQVMASVGLAQNFAALYAMVTTGIQKGHMKLHKRKLKHYAQEK
jgi:hydroxymethylglutaryl-CoA reductase